MISIHSSGQSESAGAEDEPNRHRFTLMMANAHVAAGDNVGTQGSFYIVPTWGLNYDFWFSKTFAIGLHNDIAIQDFEVDIDNATIERSFPVTTTAVCLYKPWNKITLLAGGGREFEKHESFYVLTTGVEYGIRLPLNWELSFNLIYDNKLNAYDSWLLGIGFSKLLK